jgi:hypothetical protein
VRLLHARKEARLVLEDPRAVDFMEVETDVIFIPMQFARPAGEFLEELRQTIFRSRRGNCLTVELLKRLYQPSGPGLPVGPTPLETSLQQ